MEWVLYFLRTFSLSCRYLNRLQKIVWIGPQSYLFMIYIENTDMKVNKTSVLTLGRLQTFSVKPDSVEIDNTHHASLFCHLLQFCDKSGCRTSIK